MLNCKYNSNGGNRCQHCGKYFKKNEERVVCKVAMSNMVYCVKCNDKEGKQ